MKNTNALYGLLGVLVVSALIVGVVVYVMKTKPVKKPSPKPTPKPVGPVTCYKCQGSFGSDEVCTPTQSYAEGPCPTGEYPNAQCFDGKQSFCAPAAS